uniref:Uncharacterized protein n=1 Tax=Trypanosoma vivax (strain Y486) TaxID=1055687 RepID=G0UCR3_TRYVY|nr:hypothetical protein TVY486_1111070 [Trypanosoma vivax Y486]
MVKIALLYVKGIKTESGSGVARQLMLRVIYYLFSPLTYPNAILLSRRSALLMCDSCATLRFYPTPLSTHFLIVVPFRPVPDSIVAPFPAEARQRTWLPIFSLLPSVYLFILSFCFIF